MRSFGSSSLACAVSSLACALALLAGCAHQAAPPATAPAASLAPAAANQSSEAVIRQSCADGALPACFDLGLGLASGTWGAGRHAEAVAVLGDSCRAGVEQSCFAGALVVRQHAGEFPQDEEQFFLGQVCTAGTAYACVLLAEGAVGEQAMAWTRQACANGDPWSCALAEGRAPAWPAPDPTLPADFVASLEAAHMVFTPPLGFQAVPVVENPHLAYQYAIQALDGSVEVRYRVDALAPMLAEHARCATDPDCMMADPNLIGPAMAQATAMNISGGQADAGGRFPVPPVYLEFNADQGLAFPFAPLESFAPGWDGGLLVALHRDDQGDALIVMLMKQGMDSDLAWSRAFHALRFADPYAL